MDHDDAKILNLDAYGAQLDALLRDMTAVAPPSPQQQAVARRAREIAAAIAAAIATSAPETDAETAGDWEGTRAGGYVSANGEAGGLVIALRGAEVAWVQATRRDGVSWQFDYGPALSGVDDEAGARTLRVRISRDLEVVSDISFSPEGAVHDERDWVGKMNDAWRELAEEARSVDIPDTDGPGGASGRSGAGRRKPPPDDGGGSGSGPLRGAAAGAAAAAAAAAAAGLARAAADAARSRSQEKGEPEGAESRRCPRCNRENPPSNAFCNYCGARLERGETSAAAPRQGASEAPLRCARCGQTLPQGVRFCTACGAPVTSPSPPKAEGHTCARCGAAVAPGARFCSACGAPQESSREEDPDRCPHCGRAVSPGVRFCPHCGRPVRSG